MNRKFLIPIIALVAFSCMRENKADSKLEQSTNNRVTFTLEDNSFDEEEKVFGEYYFPPKDISLNLLVPNKFELANNEFQGEDMIVTKPYAFGQFSVMNDTIKLRDSLTDKQFYLLKKSDEILAVLKCDEITSGQNFLCWTKFYPSGDVKFTGGWEDNKKEGGWRYFDEKGNETFVFYEKGKAKPIDTTTNTIADNLLLPTFPGGFDELKKYLSTNYKWTQGQFAVEGTIYVQFTVSETGSIIIPTILRGLCETCDKEALRLIKEMPNWNPARLNWKARQEKMVLPIKFGLTNPYK
jgi:protein TonB